MIMQHVELGRAAAYHTSELYDVSIGGEYFDEPPLRPRGQRDAEVFVEDSPWRGRGIWWN